MRFRALSLILAGCAAYFGQSASAATAYVQGTTTTGSASSALSSLSTRLLHAQLPGDLNVVVIGWLDATSSVQSVTDSIGNTYAVAAAPTISGGNTTQVIYFAQNIVASGAGANKITVTFNVAVPSPNLRIAEYSGIATANALDVATGASGNGTMLSSGTVATGNSNELLVGASQGDATVQNAVPTTGSGFTRRLITSGNMLADDIVIATGYFSATAGISTSSGGAAWWVMQIAAFRASDGPGAVTAAVASSTEIDLNWIAPSVGAAVSEYLVERCQGAGCTNFSQIATAPGTTYDDTTLSPSTNYSYRVRTTDAAGNMSGYSATVSAKTAAGADTQAPTAPTNLTVGQHLTNEVDVSWMPSTDNVGVTGYLLERCEGANCTTFKQIAAPTGTSYSDLGLTAATSYSYRVRATDAAGNLSPYSNIVSSTTLSGDTTPPSAPSALTGTAGGYTQINLTWTLSTDNVGVTNYLVERCQGANCTNFAQIGTTAATSYSDTGLSIATTYTYRVRATDAAGNLSDYSGTVSATTTVVGSICD
jgi:fibronectin type 3 domain-containing protein